MIQIDREMPDRCGNCPCFHFDNPMYCQAIDIDRNKKITAPYRSPRPEWCPLQEAPSTNDEKRISVKGRMPEPPKEGPDRGKTIKAIEICYTLGQNCAECPLFSVDDCNDKLMHDALSLLKEQEQEISRLKHHVDCDAAEKLPSGCVGYGPVLMMMNRAKRVKCAKNTMDMAKSKWTAEGGLNVDKLKPCPFCGHEAMLSYNSNYDFQAYCTNDACFMSQIIMEDMETEEQARAAWNKRAPSVPAVQLDKLCEWLAGNAWHLDCSDCDAEHCDCPQLHDDSGSSPAFWKEKLTKRMEEWAMEEQREEEP